MTWSLVSSLTGPPRSQPMCHQRGICALICQSFFFPNEARNIDFHVNFSYLHFKESVVQGKQNPLIDVISSMHWFFWVRTLSQVDMSGNARNVCPEAQTCWIVFIFKELLLNLLLSKILSHSYKPPHLLISIHQMFIWISLITVIASRT